ncbi:hypothetical protein ABK040_012225 [Willaertia magna]
MQQNIYILDRYENYTRHDFELKIKQVASGLDFLLILTENGTVFYKGVMKSYNNQDASDFTQIVDKNISFISHIACGESFFILVNRDDKVFICGELDNRQYNHLTEISNDFVREKDIKFISCGADIVIFVTKYDELIVSGCLQAFSGDVTFSDGFMKINNLNIKNIKDLQCGFTHTVVLDNNGYVYGSGDNSHGQLGKLEKDVEILSNLTKLNIPFKIKKMAVNIESTLLLNYFNELYGSGTDIYVNNVEVKEFTKFILSENIIIKNLFRSGYSSFNVILTDDGLYAYTSSNKIFTKLETIETIDCTNWEYNTVNINNSFGWEGVNIFQTNYKINRKQKKERIYNIYKQLLDIHNTFFDVEFLYQ